MSIIRQGSLFDLQELYDLDSTSRFDVIFSTLKLTPVIHTVSKTACSGAPVQLNYTAMVYALVARIVDRIPTIKDLVKRLKQDFLFRLDCGFLFSDVTPSEASFSRLIRKLSQTSVFEEVQEDLLLQAFQEGFLTDETVAIDATHVEARDGAPESAPKEQVEPKKRGRKSKAEREKYLLEKQEQESLKMLFEKQIQAQLDCTLEELQLAMPCSPQWGIKKNSEGKNVFWYGFKTHLAVSTKSQYILQSMLSSGSLNDGKVAIPLLKAVATKQPYLDLRYATMDAGYDVEAIYEQVRRNKAHAIVAYNKRREHEIPGYDKYFAPTCVREHSYRYDSYDPRYDTIKYTRPKECTHCPLRDDTLCQKVYKVKISTDLRKYTAPGRGSVAWKEIYAKRTAVERVIAYLKEYFQLNNIRHKQGPKAKLHLSIVSLVYNAAKLACDRMNARNISKQKAA